MAAEKKDPDWWKHKITYQIYPRSFQDSNGDGVGDLKGIESRLDYLKWLGVETIWLSPIYTSPMADFGYDVADYKNIDPIFGTLKDFDDLLKAIHDRGMYLLMDFIPNHTSDKHKWFEESKKGGRNNPYSDYYCWSSGKTLKDGTRAPPNNWLSIFGGSAWEWVEERQQFYLHQFVKEQPDLNYRNPIIREEMKNVLRFWVEKGVDGFRVDAIGTLFEVEDLSLDEPLSGLPDMRPDQHGYLLHPYTMDQAEIHDVVREWRDLFDEYEAKTGHHTYMIMEIYDPSMVEAVKYYHSGADMPFNFNLIYMDEKSGGTDVRTMIDNFLDAVPAGKWSNFVLGNHDNKRITSRKSPVYDSALNMLVLTLPGTPTTYYGEELGMRDIQVAYEDTQDPWGVNMGPAIYEKYSRDPCRAPMQWNNGKKSGFSSADKTWLPVHPDYKTRNVENQKSDKTGTSPLQVFRLLASLRKQPSFLNNKIQYQVVDDNILSYIRHEKGYASYLVMINLGNESSTNNYVIKSGDEVIKTGVVEVSTGNVRAELKKGQKVNLSNITLKPGDGAVIKL